MIGPISRVDLRPPGLSSPVLAPTASPQAVNLQSGSAITGGGITAAPDFSSLLGEAIAGVARKLQHAETVAVAGIKGQASTQDVVENVMAAEHTLQAAIAVRDKVVSAYLEISRMAI